MVIFTKLFCTDNADPIRRHKWASCICKTPNVEEDHFKITINTGIYSRNGQIVCVNLVYFISKQE